MDIQHILDAAQLLFYLTSTFTMACIACLMISLVKDVQQMRDRFRGRWR